jgi:hypothetical protein
MRPAPLVSGVRVLPLALLAVAVSAWAQQNPQPDGWRTFQGSWSAVGQRQTLPIEGGRFAAIVQLSGAVVLTDPSGTMAGFQADAIGFDDGGALSAGRAVWTDARGDRLFSALRGDTLQTGRHIVGTITGGTGRYGGVTGEYTLTWQYVVAGEDNVVQGRTVDLKGRFRSEERPR